MDDTFESDGSDIDVLFAKADEKQQAFAYSSSDDDDNNSSDDGENNHRKRSVEAKLARLGQERKIRKRNQAIRDTVTYHNSDSDSDSNVSVSVPHPQHNRNSDANAIEVDVEVIEIEDDVQVETPQSHYHTRRNSRGLHLDADFSSDDDDDQKQTTKRPKSLAQLKQQGADEATLEAFSKAQNALQALQQKQQESEIADNISYQQEAIQRQLFLVEQHRQRAMEERVIQLCIRACYQRSGKTEKTQDTRLAVRASTPFSNIQQLFFEANKLNPANTTMFFRYQTNPVGLHRTPLDYAIQSNIDEQGSLVVEATVLLSALGDVVAAKKATAVRNKGKMLSLVLRRATTKNKSESDTFRLGTKENFSNLMEQYREKKGLRRNARVVLKFDGETLRSDHTPATFDMENEDLIDVAI